MSLPALGQVDVSACPARLMVGELGVGHDHFGFNDWEVKVCFDNVKVTPL